MESDFDQKWDLNLMNHNILTRRHFEEVFGEKLSDNLGRKIDSCGFIYETLTPVERDNVILRILRALNSGLQQAGEHRREQWETGWTENLEAFKAGGPDALIPRYFGKYPILRWKQEFIKAVSPGFEYGMLATIQNWLFETYLGNVKSIYEFGCGTGHNLQRIREVNKTAKLYGLDWAQSSQQILDLMSHDDKNIEGKQFNIFKPDFDFKLDLESGICTIAALEQVGDGFKEFVDYLIQNKPTICIHVEPVGELLDENNLVDYLSIRYFKKRNYLSGFLDYLRSLENFGRIKIHRAQRSYIGSLFIEGYSVIVWAPIK